MKAAGSETKVLMKYVPDIHNKNIGAIGVTVDGSWMRRGHTFLFGVVTIIAVGCGKVTGYYLCSKYYHSCELHKCMGRKSEEFKKWLKSY